MDWSDLKDIVGKSAPLVGTLLGGPAGGAVGGIIAAALGTEAQPEKVASAIAANPDAMVRIQEIEAKHKEELERMTLENETARLVEINKTARAEAQSEDKYVRRARPTFLYVIAFSVGIEVILASIVFLVRPEQAAALGDLFAALATPQSIAAAMCGVYLKSRSTDKAIAAGKTPPPGLLSKLFS